MMIENSKYRQPIFSDSHINLSQTNPGKWWERKQEYLLLRYNKNIDKYPNQMNAYEKCDDKKTWA